MNSNKENYIFNNATEAVQQLKQLYDRSIKNLQDAFDDALKGSISKYKIQEYYPQIKIKIDSFVEINSRLAFGHVNGPGIYVTTITRPNLFEQYLIQQLSLLIKNREYLKRFFS